MKTLKAILALSAVIVIVGQVRAERHAAVAPQNVEQPLVSHPATVQVLARACGNCHSNHTEWPWYSHVAPISWWIARDVREGRDKLDFSKWKTYSARQKRDKSELCADS